MAKFSHLASFPFKNFLLMFIHATHAVLNLAPITHDHPLGGLTLSLATLYLIAFSPSAMEIKADAVYPD